MNVKSLYFSELGLPKPTRRGLLSETGDAYRVGVRTTAWAQTCMVRRFHAPCVFRVVGRYRDDEKRGDPCASSTFINAYEKASDMPEELWSTFLDLSKMTKFMTRMLLSRAVLTNFKDPCRRKGLAWSEFESVVQLYAIFFYAWGRGTVMRKRHMESICKSQSAVGEVWPEQIAVLGIDGGEDGRQWVESETAFAAESGAFLRAVEDEKDVEGVKRLLSSFHETTAKAIRSRDWSRHWQVDVARLMFALTLAAVVETGAYRPPANKGNAMLLFDKRLIHCSPSISQSFYQTAKSVRDSANLACFTRGRFYSSLSFRVTSHYVMHDDTPMPLPGSARPFCGMKSSLVEQKPPHRIVLSSPYFTHLTELLCEYTGKIDTKSLPFRPFFDDGGQDVIRAIRDQKRDDGSHTIVGLESKFQSASSGALTDRHLFAAICASGSKKEAKQRTTRPDKDEDRDDLSADTDADEDDDDEEEESPSGLGMTRLEYESVVACIGELGYKSAMDRSIILELAAMVKRRARYTFRQRLFASLFLACSRFIGLFLSLATVVPEDDPFPFTDSVDLEKELTFASATKKVIQQLPVAMTSRAKQFEFISHPLARSIRATMNTPLSYSPSTVLSPAIVSRSGQTPVILYVVHPLFPAAVPVIRAVRPPLALLMPTTRRHATRPLFSVKGQELAPDVDAMIKLEEEIPGSLRVLPLDHETMSNERVARLNALGFDERKAVFSKGLSLFTCRDFDGTDASHDAARLFLLDVGYCGSDTRLLGLSRSPVGLVSAFTLFFSSFDMAVQSALSARRTLFPLALAEQFLSASQQNDGLTSTTEQALGFLYKAKAMALSDADRVNAEFLDTCIDEYAKMFFVESRSRVMGWSATAPPASTATAAKKKRSEQKQRESIDDEATSMIDRLVELCQTPEAMTAMTDVVTSPTRSEALRKIDRSPFLQLACASWLLVLPKLPIWRQRATFFFVACLDAFEWIPTLLNPEDAMVKQLSKAFASADSHLRLSDRLKTELAPVLSYLSRLSSPQTATAPLVSHECILSMLESYVRFCIVPFPS